MILSWIVNSQYGVDKSGMLLDLKWYPVVYSQDSNGEDIVWIANAWTWKTIPWENFARELERRSRNTKVVALIFSCHSNQIGHTETLKESQKSGHPMCQHDLDSCKC